MNCPSCDAKTAADDKYCHECGARLLPVTAAEKRRAALKQAQAIAREGSKAVQQGGRLVGKGLQTRRGRSVAACAAIGAAAGSVVPILGTVSGATLGAAAGFFRKIGRDENE